MSKYGDNRYKTGKWVDKYYPDGFKSEEQKPMRNTIKVIDKDVPKVRVYDLIPGQMFRYPAKTNPDNVYMVTDHALGRGVVLLATGKLYTDFRQESEIEVIDAISIQR